MEGGKPGIVEFVGLHEGDGGHELVGGDILADAHGERYQQAECELEHQLALLRKAFFIMLEYLYIIVGESYASAPYCGEDEQLDVDVAEVAYQQHAHQQGEDYNDAAHRRGALLLHLAGQAEVPYAFADLLALEPADDASACEEGYQHADDYCGHGPEGQEVHKPHSGEVYILEMCKEMV